MMATTPHFDSNEMPRPSEAALPYFLDGINADCDDLDDWWLDLGSVVLA